MVNTTVTLILAMIVFSVWVAAAARTKLHSINGKEGQFAYSPPRMVFAKHWWSYKATYATSTRLQRMPTAHSGQPAKNPPVLLQHGLVFDGVTWLLNSPKESLASILADNGYDVWIANTRGTKYSKKHESLTPLDQAFWEWSWDELMAYDLTAFVQFGTLMALASFSKNKLLDKIRSAALLCPIAHLGHMTSPLRGTATILAEDSLSDVNDVKLLLQNLKNHNPKKLVENWKLLQLLITEVNNGRHYNHFDSSDSIDLCVGRCCNKNKALPNQCNTFDGSGNKKDGYILSMQRMRNKRSGQAARKPPVFLQHGLFMNGITWLLNSPNESLADHGYDAYWNWSWDEVMAYDLTAFVKFVYHKTGKKLHYVGHSMGTLIALAAFSDHRLLKKIRSAALLTPIAHLGHMKSPIARFSCQFFLAEVR
ncbi:hypothetical protein Patl1_01925 [Pistacia atlantica]|uniref:Uncharacterized protein n=1 Tax=Pistacia atlantica TaxID=434234 RepID=A0ACC1C7R7_9ROSI|nr:hypothetical protein Patl1_01925 [Pistacia atlantica]